MRRRLGRVERVAVEKLEIHSHRVGRAVGMCGLFVFAAATVAAGYGSALRDAPSRDQVVDEADDEREQHEHHKRAEQRVEHRAREDLLPDARRMRRHRGLGTLVLMADRVDDELVDLH